MPLLRGIFRSMRKLRLLLSLLLLLVLPLQGYAMARASLLGPDCAAHAQAGQTQDEHAQAGMPCHEMQPAAQTPAPSGDDHNCIKCPLCALHAGAPTRAPMAFPAIAPRDAPAGTFAAPAMIYLDLPLPVPRA